MKEFIFIWYIKNISYSWHKTGEKMVSPKFIAGPIQNSVWSLRFYPRGSVNSDYFSLELGREKDDNCTTTLAINFEFSCILADASIQHTSTIPENLKIFKNEGYSHFEETCFIQRFEVFGRKKTLYLPRDTLTLRCRMWQYRDTNELDQCFGCTRFEVDRIITVEKICHLVDKTFTIHSEKENEDIMSVSVLYYSDKIDVKTNRISQLDTKFSTFSLYFVDGSTGRKLYEHESCYFGDPSEEHWKFSFSNKALPTENENSEISDIEMITELAYSKGEETEIMGNDFSPRSSEFIFIYLGRAKEDPSNHPVSNIFVFNIPYALWCLCNAQILCDVELKFPKKSFYAHKCVLSARSPVFLKMLTSEMNEKENESIEIEDISAETMEIFLRFLYTDYFTCVTGDALVELYHASCIYEVELLKLKCCSYLLKNLDVGNICELLTLADRHHDSVLKRQVNEIIWKDDEAVFGSLAWKKFADEQPHMAVETMFWNNEKKENQSLEKALEELIFICPKMEHDLLSLYRDQIHCDIFVKTSEDSFPAHKAVLGACSLSFLEAYTQDLKEESTDFYDMKDWDSMTVSLMLRFLYDNSLENIQWDMAVKLYQLAVEFKIQRLKYESACFLIENLTVYNAIELLLEADQHDDIALQSTVEDFIQLYDEEIFGSEAWDEFCETNAELAFEIMRTIVT